MYRSNSILSVLKMYIGIIICLITLISVTNEKINIDNCEFKLTNQIFASESNDFSFEFTNNTEYAIGKNIVVLKIEKLIGNRWTEISKPETMYETDLIYDGIKNCIYPGETVYFSWKTDSESVFGNSIPEPGTYRMVIEYASDYKTYNSKNIHKTAILNYEFEVVPY